MEQFEQLLTCCVCLDRFRNPKLLPCQHSFCMEPCMEGLIDYVKRQVRISPNFLNFQSKLYYFFNSGKMSRMSCRTSYSIPGNTNFPNKCYTTKILGTTH